MSDVNLSILKNGRAKAIRFTTLTRICEVPNCRPGDLLSYRPRRAMHMRGADAGVMSHHLSGPDLRSPMDDARLDLTDLFAFGVPGDRTVLIMNAHPVATAAGAVFHPDAV
ncbi:hypothetical protein GCM10010207_82710 [Streptomyces atratus]|nr:hypothetical protein GCM10010207_82710 [Streptomyces atratus]